jgi:hypothetical protein
VARVRAYAQDARGVEREVASSEFRVEAGGLIRYVGDTAEPSESSGVLVSSVATPVGPSSQLTITPPSYDRGTYDGGTAGGPITQMYAVDPNKPIITETLPDGTTITYLNYLNPEMRMQAKKWAIGYRSITDF